MKWELRGGVVSSVGPSTKQYLGGEAGCPGWPCSPSPARSRPVCWQSWMVVFEERGRPGSQLGHLGGNWVAAGTCLELPGL